ncbi:DUF3618 domain-containing protein [Microbacterium sp. EYE_5]|uniref:DUF3618 domain-containing protein n=1 Tax=unclassified Microbacterium TaxID=2609290 RepID=UPI002003AF07|nr:MULTISPECIES: DUF3618 domain-containing protein [unclassified Microbacterium]MCK6081753.1 DUF3618 domain-containing protein [Microbacterium sp. EYE_382]MCK6087023.1 DUF3618 domain-containing protein [Microbacterium sp. EYE_384]MCK6124999.1 DUF3618 domain-containing protein [Microbacterium sp. EYE_80]MCK6127786.1 DUF3618 domain-containing protein [Microbacterium sp. EYE_79]MCK6142707.1 DUF3618 domain-containing protein [Microbacterium sp. EYE_39]
MTTPDVPAREVPLSATPATKPELSDDASVAEIEADIARTRADLGDTVEQLAGKLDVKARAKQQVETVKTNVAAQIGDAREHAADYVHQATDALTDDAGKPNRNGWIALAVVVVAIGAVITAVARRGR